MSGAWTLEMKPDRNQSRLRAGPENTESPCTSTVAREYDDDIPNPKGDLYCGSGDKLYQAGLLRVQASTLLFCLQRGSDFQSSGHGSRARPICQIWYARIRKRAVPY